MIERIVNVETKSQLFLAIMIGAAVVSFWRGVWQALDLYLLPQNHAFSVWISIILGLFILLFAGNLTKKLL